MALFALICHDKPNSLELRMKNREAHLAYGPASGVKIVLGGPLMSEDGSTMQGSLLVIDVPDLEAAKKFSAGDPYVKAGLFESITIRPWRKVIGTAEL